MSARGNRPNNVSEIRFPMMPFGFVFWFIEQRIARIEDKELNR
jgi:hypothetical protein